MQANLDEITETTETTPFICTDEAAKFHKGDIESIKMNE